MKLAILALTKRGTETAINIAKQLNSDVYVKEAFLTYGRGLNTASEELQTIKIQGITEGLQKLVGQLFSQYEGLIFIMACGIVVRSIAPYIVSKKSDPAVVVLDENGQNIISLLSGHIGGANALTNRVAMITGGNPIITTATDINGVVSLDVFAKENALEIENFELLKSISGHLVNGGTIGLCSDYPVKGELNGDEGYRYPAYIGAISTQVTEDISDIENISCIEEKNLEYWVALTNKEYLENTKKRILFIRPKNLIIGIGCKKNTSKEQIERAVSTFLKETQRSIAAIKCVATIDIKMKEEGIISFCSENRIELVEVSREKIKCVEQDYACSDYVKSIVGVGCVAEPCAVLAGNSAELIVQRTVFNGITLALAEEKGNILFVSNNHWYIKESGRKP